MALGHIHKPRIIKKDHIIYAGALEPTDKNDTGKHGYVKGEITEKGVRTQWVPCACREYVHLDLTVELKIPREASEGRSKSLLVNMEMKIFTKLC